MCSEEGRIKADDLQHFCAEVFHNSGLSREDAALMAELLVEADLRGYSTHGVVRMGTYLDYAKHGVINVKATIQTLRDEAAIALIDGDDGFGQIVASRAVDIAVNKAEQYGIGAVGVRNSGHLGALGLIAKRAAAQRMIGLVYTNAGPVMAAWGGSKPVLGNNPFAVCIPRENGPAVLIDMALSTTARGNIILAEREGKEIPEGWALDRAGRPTTNPTEALLGSVMPMAGHKGYVLSLLMELLTSVLVGGLPGYSLGLLAPPQYERPLGTSNLVIAINVGSFIEWDRFQASLEHILGYIKESAEQEEQIFIPGERSDNQRQHHAAFGIQLQSNIVAELKRLAEEYNVSFPAIHN